MYVCGAYVFMYSFTYMYTSIISMCLSISFLFPFSCSPTSLQIFLTLPPCRPCRCTTKQPDLRPSAFELQSHPFVVTHKSFDLRPLVHAFLTRLVQQNHEAGSPKQWALREQCLHSVCGIPDIYICTYILCIFELIYNPLHGYRHEIEGYSFIVLFFVFFSFHSLFLFIRMRERRDLTVYPEFSVLYIMSQICCGKEWDYKM